MKYEARFYQEEFGTAGVYLGDDLRVICGDLKEAEHYEWMLNQENAPLLARIAELEAAVQMNLDASTDIAEDESIDAMRGRLQSIRAKSTHALKKAGGND